MSEKQKTENQKTEDQETVGSRAGQPQASVQLTLGRREMTVGDGNTGDTGTSNTMNGTGTASNTLSPGGSASRAVSMDNNVIKNDYDGMIYV